VGVRRQVRGWPGWKRRHAQFNPLLHEQGIEEIVEILGNLQFNDEGIRGGGRTAGGKSGLQSVICGGIERRHLL
jgi:hypothetical protein